MKKLFSTMLAATMVAGMAVTAFAGTKAEGITTKDSHDFGVMGAYDEDGNKIQGKKTKVDGGDKLYFPILVSGEELLDQKDKATDDSNAEIKDDSQMYFATKASEVKNLKASVKDEIGGKYIDSAAIVKKDIKIDKKGEADVKEIFTVDLSKVVPKTVSGTVAEARKFTESSITGWTITNNNDYSSDKKEIAEDITVELAKDKVTDTTMNFTLGSEKASIATFATCSGDQTVTLGKITIKITEAEAKKLTEGSKVIGKVSAYKPAGKDTYTAKVGATDITGITAATKEAFLTALNGKTVDIGGVNYVADTTTATAVKFTATTIGNKDDVKSVNVTTDAAVPYAATKVQDGSGSGASIGKVYCVEVKMADYFKAEETEVEFNIKLKDGGKTAFDTDDDKLENGFFNATFDLGKDTETLDVNNKKAVKGVEVKKFKKGDLEILIGKNTRSVQLDEAINSENKKEDITNIYIENDKTIDNAFTFDVKASSQDDLYLELNQDAIKDLAVSNSRADLTFFNFPGKPEFDFTGKATFAVEDDDKDNYFYEIVDGELVESKAKYNKEDGVFELRTNKLGSYVISDKELKVSDGKKEENDTESKEQEGTGGDATVDATTGSNGEKGNANTGAADLIGVASALAVVSIAAAGAVALKK